MAHYWRLDREAWPSVGESIRQSESTAITVYIPWEVHETVPADLDAFLTLCEDTGLDVIARPGPQINADHWRDLQSLVLRQGPYDEVVAAIRDRVAPADTVAQRGEVT